MICSLYDPFYERYVADVFDAIFICCFRLENEEKGPEHADPISKEKNFIFLRIPVLREYLERELAMQNLPFKYDFERVIDDWVGV